MAHTLVLALMLGAVASQLKRRRSPLQTPVAINLRRVTAAAAEPNDNRVPAGVLRDGVLTLRMVARPAA